MGKKLETFRINDSHSVVIPSAGWRLLVLCQRFPGGIEAVVSEVDRFRTIAESDPRAWSTLSYHFPLLRRIRAAGFVERNVTATIARFVSWLERINAGLAPEDGVPATPQARREATPAPTAKPYVDPSRVAQFVLMQGPENIRRELVQWQADGFIGRRLNRVLHECRGATADLIAKILIDLDAHDESVRGRVE